MTAAARPLDGMTLGDLLAGARREAGAFAQWLTQADPALAARIASQSAADEDLAGFARCAVANFGIDAEDADWSHLISAVRDAADPAVAAIGVMVRWQLAQTPP